MPNLDSSEIKPARSSMIERRRVRKGEQHQSHLSCCEKRGKEKRKGEKGKKKGCAPNSIDNYRKPRAAMYFGHVSPVSR